MRENIERPGPLDKIRFQLEDASRLDDQAIDGNPGTAKAIAEEVCETGKSFSFIDRDVTAYGDVLVKVAPNPDKRVVAALQSTGNVHAEARGIYRGMRIIDVNDTTGKVGKRVVHVLETGKEEFFDAYQNFHTRTDYVCVCARGGSVFPLDPEDAHSNIELRNDQGTMTLLEILYRSGEESGDDLLGEWQDLGWEVNQQLTRGENGKRLNHQRVSLLNQIHKFEGFRATADDFIRGNPNAGDSLTRFPLSDPAEGEVEIILGKFAIFKNYRRSEHDDMGMIVTAKKELYVRGMEVRDGDTEGISPVVVAVKNIVSIAP